MICALRMCTYTRIPIIMNYIIILCAFVKVLQYFRCDLRGFKDYLIRMRGIYYIIMSTIGRTYLDIFFFFFNVKYIL